MQRLRVVDAVRNSRFVQLLDKCFAVIGQHGVLRVGAGASVLDVLRHDFCAVNATGSAKTRAVFREKLVVLAGVLAAHLQFVFEVAELDPQDGGLQGVEPAVQAHGLVKVAFLAPVIREHANLLGELRIMGKDGAAVPVAAQRLARVETRDGNGGEGAGAARYDIRIWRHSDVVLRTECLGRIFQKPQVVRDGDFPKRCFGQMRKRSALPEQVHADNPARLGADQRLHAFRVNQQRLGVDVREPRYAAQERHALRRCNEREVGDYDLVPRFEPERHERDGEGVGTACARYGLGPGFRAVFSRKKAFLSGVRTAGIAKIRKFRLQGLDFGPADVASAVQNGAFCGLEFFSVGLPLPCQVHEWHHNARNLANLANYRA